MRTENVLGTREYGLQRLYASNHIASPRLRLPHTHPVFELQQKEQLFAEGQHCITSDGYCMVLSFLWSFLAVPKLWDIRKIFSP